MKSTISKIVKIAFFYVISLAVVVGISYLFSPEYDLHYRINRAFLLVTPIVIAWGVNMFLSGRANDVSKAFWLTTLLSFPSFLLFLSIRNWTMRIAISIPLSIAVGAYAALMKHKSARQPSAVAH